MNDNDLRDVETFAGGVFITVMVGIVIGAVLFLAWRFS